MRLFKKTVKYFRRNRILTHSKIELIGCESTFSRPLRYLTFFHSICQTMQNRT